MKIPTLSLWQPWASMIFRSQPDGAPWKPDETRGWPVQFRGRIGIHAAMHRLSEADMRLYTFPLQRAGLLWSRLPYGCLLGTALLTECNPAEEAEVWRTGEQRFWGDYRAIGDDGKPRFAFAFEDRRILSAPIPFKGKQGFFHADFPDIPKGIC